MARLPLVTGSIPNMINGVSQQPYVLRLPNQAESQINGYSSVVDGLTQRPATKHIAKLATTTRSNAFLHTMNRDETEKYSAIFSTGDVEVFDLFTGAAQTVNFEEVTKNLIVDAVATETSDGYQIYLPATETTVTLVTAGITTATVVWEKSATGLFAGEETTVRTDTTDTSATVAWTSGDYIRARLSAYTSGTIDANVLSNNTNYINAADPKATLRAVTVADYTFLVNSTVTTAVLPELTAVRPPEAIAWVKKSDYGRTFKITITPDSGTTRAVTYTTPDGSTAAHTSSLDTVYIADQLKTVLDTYPELYIARYQDALHIKYVDEREFSIATEDGQGGTGMIGIKEAVQQFKDLPQHGPDGFDAEIAGDDKSAFDNYYVKFDKQNDANGNGVWVETVKGGITYKLDPTTMPHLLVREANGTFSFKQQTWEERDVGDDVSNPPPSFIGFTIEDVFFYRNRLGVLADENVIMSRAGKFENFWQPTVTTVLDDGPIDVAAAHNKVSLLKHAVPYDEQLLLFSALTQFRMGNEKILTPSTVEIEQTTEFQVETTTKPIASGNNVYFASPKGSWTGVREYVVDKTTAVKDAADVTSHVPKYIPKNVFLFTAADNEEILVALSRDAPDTMFVYKYYWSGNEKLQSSWSEWKLEETGVNILAAEFIRTTMYLVIERSDGVYLESLNVELGQTDTDSVYSYLVDRKIYESDCTVSYDSGTNQTTITLPYTVSTGATMAVAVRAGDATSPEGRVLPVVSQVGTDIVVSGDHSSTLMVIGQEYSLRYKFSTFIMRATENGAKVSMNAGRLQIGKLDIKYAATGFFQVIVTPEYSAPYTYTFTGRVTGSNNNVIGAASLEDGDFYVPIGSRNTEVTVEVVSSSMLPCSFQGAEWEGMYTYRATRV